MSEDSENLVFNEHEDLSEYSDFDLNQLLQINQQTSKHYQNQINSKDVPDSLKHMYTMSKGFVDSDIKDIQNELESRAKNKKNDIHASVVSTCTTQSNG